ncbi:MAG: barstar family protein [Leptospiraceae bacterium]|nr:barstar family protein [Leptospiraceae bacterium]
MVKKDARPLYIIHGEKVHSLDDFYDEMARLTGSLTGKGPDSRNLNALLDVLRGGLAAHEYMEPITLIWSNFHLGSKFSGKADVLECIAEAENVTFRKENFECQGG